MRLLIVFLILFSLKGFAETPDLNADLDRLQSQLQQFDNDPDNPLKETYQLTLQHLQDVISLSQQAQNLRAEIEAQPQQRERARQQTAAADSLLSNDPLPKDELQSLLVKVKARLIDLEKNQDELRQTIRDNDKLLLNQRTKRASLEQQLNGPSKSIATPATDLQKARAKASEYQQMALELALEVSELQILALPGRAELASLNLTNLQTQIQHYNTWINSAEERLQQENRADAEKTLSQVETADTDSNPILQQALTRNSETANLIRQGFVEAEQTNQQRKQLEQQLQVIRQTYQAIQAQLELGFGYTGSEIRRHIQKLPKTLTLDGTKDRLKALRLSQLSLSQPILQPAGIVELSPAQQSKLNQLNQSYVELISEQRSLQQKLISELSQLLLMQDQFNAQIIDSRALFNKHLLWLPSAEPISFQWPGVIIKGFIALFDELPQLLQPYLAQLSSKIELPLGLFILSLPFSVLCRRYLTQRQPQWCKQIGNVTLDHIRHTLRPLLYQPVVTLPIPLFIYALGRQFGSDAPSISNLLYIIAFISWLYLTVMRWMQRSYGLIQGQFGLPEQLTTTLRKRLRMLFWTNTPLIALLFILDPSSNDMVIAGPTRLTLLCITLTFILFWLSLWRAIPQPNLNQQQPRFWSNTRAWIGLIIGFNIAMLGLTLWGYMLSAGILTGLMFLLICIAILAYLIFSLGRRWLLIEERKLYFNRTLARRAEIVSAREEQKDTPPVKENFIDIQTISEQGHMLIKTVTALVFISLAWLVLGWTLPALDVLDSVTLWSTGSSDSGVLSFITLKQVVFALAALTITFIAARNLPGLFELLVLNYLPLAPGTGFAISTLLKYTLYIIGLISFLNFLGLEWGKLQWLIAAMGVGLGFGLQEIVANFVSGLIILFEKPIRIGDTITIGGVTGNVSRIHIRATTITDWDRKEVIIPNKTFITDQLINWSLTDPITRIIVPVGVAYGSDTGLVTQLLLQAAAGNKNVLSEPQPLAYFLSFGNSTLDFELRAYISSMDKRNQATHDLHRTIDLLFREHGIEIAFPQLDLHLRSNDSDKNADHDAPK